MRPFCAAPLTQHYPPLLERHSVKNIVSWRARSRCSVRLQRFRFCVSLVCVCLCILSLVHVVHCFKYILTLFARRLTQNQPLVIRLNKNDTIYVSNASIPWLSAVFAIWRIWCVIVGCIYPQVICCAKDVRAPHGFRVMLGVIGMLLHGENNSNFMNC